MSVRSRRAGVEATTSLPLSEALRQAYAIIARAQPDLTQPFDGETTLADAILAPTRIYAKPLLALMQALPVKGMAHITGGGLTGNVPRILPPQVRAEISRAEWPRPKLFDWLQHEGGVAESEMHRVFNCGIGLVIVVAAGDVDATLAELAAAQVPVWRIGCIRERSGEEPQTVVV